MCGIIGLNENKLDILKSAGDNFKYRGPDAYGVFNDNLMSLGHYRLSILDPDIRSNQPMADKMGTIQVVFNGEIYNFKALKNKLEKKYSFTTTSDTEVLIYAYKEWGVKMTDYIQGMFAVAVYDLNQAKLFLFRDHAGIKPLYYYAEDELFIFSSELKGITSILKEKKLALNIDPKSMDLYFTLGYIPSPNTLYVSIKKVPKSSFVEYDLSHQKIKEPVKYEPFFNKVFKVEAYEKLLERKVLDHLISDVPVGIFFSGGTDSSLIASILHKHNINLEAFSIKINYKTEDVKYFEKISQHLNLKSHVFSFDVSELDEVYEEIMTKIDEPTYDNSIFPTYFVSKKAAEKVKVVLSGEGGDEYFYGYPRSLVLFNLNKYADYSITIWDRLFFFLPSFKAKNHLFLKLFVFLKQPFSYYLLSMSPARDAGSIGRWKQVKEEFYRRRVKPVELDQEFYLENDLLRKTDLATSYVSIEGRVPLLDVDIINNAENFETQKLAGGVLKSFLKKILTNYLPSDLVYRSKSGFGLDMVFLFKESKYLRADLITSLDFLARRGVEVPKIKSLDKAINKYPHLCFSIIALYRAIYNNEK